MLIDKTEKAINASIYFDEVFIAPKEGADLLDTLIQTLNWRQDIVSVFGKEHPIPRLQCFQGEPSLHYRYSNLLLTTEPWHPLIFQLKQRIEAVSGAMFNAVLINYYRDGADRMGWHSDDEPELGKNPCIASLSLGCKRRFLLKHRMNKQLKLTYELGDGSLFIMAGQTQHFWQHSVPASKRIHTPRINLTFRYIYKKEAQ